MPREWKSPEFPILFSEKKKLRSEHIFSRCSCHGHADECDMDSKPNYKCKCFNESNTQGYQVVYEACSMICLNTILSEGIFSRDDWVNSKTKTKNYSIFDNVYINKMRLSNFYSYGVSINAMKQSIDQKMNKTWVDFTRWGSEISEDDFRGWFNMFFE